MTSYVHWLSTFNSASLPTIPTFALDWVPVTPNGHDHPKTKRVNKMLIIGHQLLYVFMLANKVGAECQTETKFNKKVQYNTSTTNIIWSESDIWTDYTIHPMAAQISLFEPTWVLWLSCSVHQLKQFFGGILFFIFWETNIHRGERWALFRN